MGQRLDRFRGTATGKVLFIGFLVLLLLIPLGMLKGLIAERSRLRSMAEADISNSWGGAQMLGGPVLVMPFRYRRYYSHGVTDIVTDEIYVLPQELAIEGGLATQVLRRGLHEVPVYSASLSVTGLVRPATLNAEEYEDLEILWSEALFALPLSDARSIREAVRITIGGTAVEFQPGGARVPGLGNQLVASLAAFGLERLDDAQAFSFELAIGGTGSLRFLPFGDLTRVNLTSDWPSPSFAGAFLPASRSVEESGFSAAWQVPHLGRGYPSVWKRSDVTGQPPMARPQAIMQAMPEPTPAFIAGVSAQASAFGVDLFVPIGIHEASLRAVKYAVMFIGLSFLAYFAFEVFGALRLHALHYLLVGLANCLFYLLLLASAEHVGFGPAYAGSTAASIALIGGYSAAILQSWRRALPVAAMLCGVYAYLYITLLAEDFALLSGALALFGILAAFMYLTRNVDWHSVTFDRPA
jgi:inner membrane protein